MDRLFAEAAQFLTECKDALILTHQAPDGDTLGSAFALQGALRLMGKKARVICHDSFPEKFKFITSHNDDDGDFEAQNIIAVDVADPRLLGEKLDEYKDKVDFCIDHHASNVQYAKNTLVIPEASATCEVLFRLFEQMQITPTLHMATCLYTGIATDTGCFKFSNTTIDTHIAAAVLIAYGVDYAWINRQMFDVKTKERIKLESFLGGKTEYFFDDRVALIAVTTDIQKEYSMTPNDFDGISALTTRVESVEIGIVIKQRGEKTFKISMRSTGNVNVGKLCVALGGGGHAKAAGCLLNGAFEEVKEKLIKCAGEAL